MSKDKKIPAPTERPELYDDFDARPGDPHLSDAYRDAVLPDNVKQRIAERKAKRA